MATVTQTPGAQPVIFGIRWPAREIMGEFIGTFTLVLLSVSGNCVAVSSSMKSGESDIFCSTILALSVAAAYFIAGGVSGGHFNPLVTLGFSIAKKFPSGLVLPYMVTQFVAALAGTGLAAFIHKDSLNGRFDNNIYAFNVEISSAFAGQPQPQIPWTVFAASTFMASFTLLVLIHAITDKKNMQVPLCLFGHFIGFFAYGIVYIVYGSIWIGGPQINPARDIASRLLNYGRGHESASPWFVTTTTLFSFFGACIGSYFYVIFEEYHWRYVRLEPDGPVGNPGSSESFARTQNTNSRITSSPSAGTENNVRSVGV